MPRVSKADRIKQKSGGTKPGAVPPEKEKLDRYICTRCGRPYIRQKNNFPASQSPLFIESGYLPVCNNCVDHLYDHYKEALGSGEAAMERICMKFDIYWNPEIWGMINKINTSASRVRQYISKTFLVRYIGRSYDDTLDEQTQPPKGITIEDVTRQDDGDEDAPPKPDVAPETVLFWGDGFDEAMYRELDTRFERWTKHLPKPLGIVEEALYKQICIQEAQINRKAALGLDVEKGQSALNNLLSSLNVKPNQKKDDESGDLDSTPLGVWAKRWEEKRPIPDYDGDTSGARMIRYILTWFYGHLGRAFGLKNITSRLYADAMDKYRVTKPEYDGEDDDELLVDLFGDGGSEVSGSGGDGNI